MIQAQILVLEDERVEITASNCSLEDLPLLREGPRFLAIYVIFMLFLRKFDWFTVLSAAFVIG